MNDRSEESVAWAAGLFEGEGCVHLIKSGRTRIIVEMLDEDVVRRFADVVGCGSVNARADHGSWVWEASDRWDVADVLRTIRPLMGERRRRKADEALERIQEQMH